MARAIEPDGYVNTYWGAYEARERYSDPAMGHELYCAGHLIEAAVAYRAATGKTVLLDVARRMADHMLTQFGPGRRHWVTGHEELELALVKLYGATGELPSLPDGEADVGGARVRVRGEQVPDDWSERWKRFHAPVLIGGEVYVRPAVARLLATAVAPKGAALSPRDRFQTLSDREATVLRLVAEGYSGAEIARQLDVSTKTVDAYKHRIHDKLGLQHRTEYVRFAIEAEILGA